jgi:homoserine kinase type II
MAIYTSLSPQQLEEISRAFDLGEVREHRFIPEGSINTNASLVTAKGRYFLRHTTVRSEEDLAFEASLLEHLARARLAAPVMLRSGKGLPFHPIAGGRACVFEFLEGSERSREEVAPEHCERLGVELARMHGATADFTGQRKNPYSREVVSGWLEVLQKHVDPELREIADELQTFLRTLPPPGSEPQGVIHADLFLDNVKWKGEEVSALFDFEMACRAPYVLDFAITLNAWCFDRTYLPGHARAFTRGYQSVRPLGAVEKAALHPHAVAGAIRFTVSRIRDFHLSTLPPDQLFRKDFRTYLARTHELIALGPKGFGRLLGL